MAPQPPEFPDLADIFPAANRMQRAAFDLVGVRAADAEDQRRWLRHGAWPKGSFRCARASMRCAYCPTQPDNYAFVQVTGDGVHEIPVGPVHAGTIEPGHFRFSVVGERVLRLEERLGYTHKGIEKRFESLSVHEACRLAGRVSGDSTVAYAWAYAMAAESAAVLTPPARALWLRALLLERERIANHLGDLGFLGNDAGLAFGLAQLSRLKEDVLRLNARIVRASLSDGCDRSGRCGVRRRRRGRCERCAPRSRCCARRCTHSRAIFDEHPGLQDRFIGTGRVRPELADAARAERSGRTCERHGLGSARAVPDRTLRSDWTCGWPRIATATWLRA